MRVRNPIVIIAIAWMSFALTAHATVQSLPFTDHFAYSEGDLFSVASGVWGAGGGAGPEFTVSTNAALTSPSGFAASLGKGVLWQPSSTARRNLVQFSFVASGEVYASFLISIQTAPSSGSRCFAYLENTTSSTTSPQLGIFVDGTSSIGVGKKATVPAVTSSPLSAGTHLVVVRYTFLSGNDQGDLWVDPSSSDYGATNASVSGIVTNNAGVAKGPFAP